MDFKGIVVKNIFCLGETVSWWVSFFPNIKHKHIKIFCLQKFLVLFFQVTDNNTLDHLGDNVDKHIDTYTKTSYAQFKYVIEILNAR